MKPLKHPNTITPNTFHQRQITKERAGVYQNVSCFRFVAPKRNYLLAKRVFDILFSVSIILFLLSWLLPVLAILIWLDSKGPVFFKQQRIGLNGKPFICFKLRTMILNSEADELPARKNDDRVTRIGTLLRSNHLDELPQFFNVLAGHMSVVGPRPHMTTDCTRFSFVISSYASRHAVKPGITGWAQVKGYHGPTVNYESIINRYYWDIEYIRHCCLLLDARIIAFTITTIINKLPARHFHFLRKDTHTKDGLRF